MDDRTKLQVLERDLIELASINQELLDTVIVLVKRLEALPDAEPLNAARSGIVHIEARLHDLLTHYLGKHERRQLNFPHPESQSEE